MKKANPLCEICKKRPECSERFLHIWKFGVVFAAFIDSAFFGVTPSLRSLFGMLIIVAAAATCLGLIAKKNGKFVPTLRSQPSD